MAVGVGVSAGEGGSPRHVSMCLEQMERNPGSPEKAAEGLRFPVKAHLGIGQPAGRWRWALWG